MKKSAFYLLIVGLLVASFALISGCGGAAGGGGTPASRGTYTYYGTERDGGNTISFVVGNGTINASFESGSLAGITVEATFRTFSSGVLTCEVTFSGSPGSIAVGDTFNAIEFQNVLFIAAVGSEQDLMVCPVRATIEPIAPFSCNAVMIPWDGWLTDPTPGKYAYATIEATKPSAWQFEIKIYDINGNIASYETVGGYTFSPTVGSFTKDADSPVIFLSPSGAFIATNGEDNGGGFAGSSRTAMTTTELLSHNYKGIGHVVDPSSGDGDLKGIIIKRKSSTVFNIYSFDQVTGVESPQGTCEVFAQNSDNMFPIIFRFEDMPSAALGWGQASSVNGKILLCGISTIEQNPSGPSDVRPMNFLLYQQ